MKIATFTPGVSILAQPTVAEVGELAARGFRSIITNRPEGESADQPAWEDLAAAASAHGMEADCAGAVVGDVHVETGELRAHVVEDAVRADRTRRIARVEGDQRAQVLQGGVEQRRHRWTPRPVDCIIG